VPLSTWHPRHAEIRLTLERPPQVMGAVRAVAEKLYDGQNKVVGLVQRIDNFVLRDSDCVRTGGAPLHLQETELACTRDAALDIVAQFLLLAICRFTALPFTNPPMTGSNRG
jgi:hypothetical protein